MEIPQREIEQSYDEIETEEDVEKQRQLVRFATTMQTVFPTLDSTQVFQVCENAWKYGVLKSADAKNEEYTVLNVRKGYLVKTKPSDFFSLDNDLANIRSYSEAETV